MDDSLIGFFSSVGVGVGGYEWFEESYLEFPQHARSKHHTQIAKFRRNFLSLSEVGGAFFFQTNNNPAFALDSDAKRKKNEKKTTSK